MGDLTKNFSRWEFRCRCGCGAEGIMPETVGALQLLRDRLGVPIHVTSGYRCPAHLDQVKRPGSRHGLGEAADFVATGLQPLAVANEAAELEQIGGIGVDPHRGFTHIDIRERMPTRWTYDTEGNVVARPI